MIRSDELAALLVLAQRELRALRREAATLPLPDAARLLKELARLSEESREIARLARAMRGH